MFTVGQRVEVHPMGIASLGAPPILGTVVRVIPEDFEYEVQWDDGEYPGETWSEQEIQAYES